MSRVLFLTILFTACALPSAAHACTDSSQMKSYFFLKRPADVSGAQMIRVKLLRVEGPTVEAELVGPSARFSPDGRVWITLPEPPVTTNCVDWGDRDTLVFVAGVFVRYESGRLGLRAVPLDMSPIRGRPTAELDKYIVDPAYLPGRP